MKSSIMRFAVIVGLLSLSATVAMAKTTGSPSPSSGIEFTASAPSFPDLPQDEDFVCGDVNENGMVNVLDIIALVNYIMGGNPSPFNEDAADVKADGLINVLDIIALVNIIMQAPGQPCGCVAPVLYEGQTYATVQIGEQCWFKENLNVGTMINSTQGGYQQQDNGTIEKYCYNNDEANCDVYGGMYEWPEVMQYITAEGAQGICPAGWHIPTEGEWKILEGTVDSQYPVGDPEWDEIGYRGFDVGGNLKEAGTVHWLPPNTGAINSSGFTILPGGFRSGNSGQFEDLGIYTGLWSSLQFDALSAFERDLFCNRADIYRYHYQKNSGLSVRCLKGCWPEPSQSNAGPNQLNVPGTSTTLAGNTPTNGTGLWAIVSGTGGTIVTPTSPTSEFQGVAGNEYTLSWTITTACGSSADQVVISFICAPQPTPANAGPDQLNVAGTFTTLAGNTPAFGTGQWTIVSGTGGTIVTPTSPTSEFQGVAGNEYTLSWTITTACGSSADEVVISFAAAMGQPCPGLPTIEYEGQTYNTVQIGDQCWLKENMNVGTMINSSSPGGYQQTDNGTIEKYCYNNNAANCAIYGGLYEWSEAMQYVTTEGAQGICPVGWHIPTDNEWKELEGTVDSQYPVGDPEWDKTGWRGFDAGGNLKEAGTTHWNSPNTGATNSSGFTGLPGGYRASPGSFSSLGNYGGFYSSSQYSTTVAWYKRLYYGYATVYRYAENKEGGFSVRCLKDN